jgi:hypothetical protein
MNKLIVILFLILSFTSCQKKNNSIIDEIEFRGRTFNIHSKSEIDTMIVDFQYSTHQVFGHLWSGKIPWRISHYDKTNILVLDNRVIGIKKDSDNSFDCTYIGLTDQFFKMSERKPKWNKEHLYGTWIEEKYIATDSSDFPPPPILKHNTNWPPSYTITKEKIVFDFYRISESKIQIPNSSDFIQMNLRNPIRYSEKDYNWVIKLLSENSMTIIRDSEIDKENENVQNSEEIRLIKKR